MSTGARKRKLCLNHKIPTKKMRAGTSYPTWKSRVAQECSILEDSCSGFMKRSTEGSRQCEGDKIKKSVKRKSRKNEEEPRKKKTRTDETKERAQTPREEFESKYKEEGKIGEGGCGSVFAGYRKADHFPVAIKHVAKDSEVLTQLDENGIRIPAEVAVMLKLKAERPDTKSPVVSLLDWYDLDLEIVIVMERPVPAVDLLTYLNSVGRDLQEEEAKVILRHLVAAAIQLERKNIFHRDIKVENILLETGSDDPRVCLIDFGLSCFDDGLCYRTFFGTPSVAPPEWIRHRTYCAEATTVWQLGVVLFEILHGESFTVRHYLKRKIHIKSYLSEDCQDLLQRCLAKRPYERLTLRELQSHPWMQ